jgi:lipoprotein-releasing system ATP-binding protein
MNKAPFVLQAKNLSKSFATTAGQLEVVKGLSLNVHEGEILSIVGASGSGKSTLLHVLGGLDQPDQGEVWLGDQNLAALSEDKRSALRNQSIGFVYQFHHLLHEFTALENVAMPLRIRGLSVAHSAQQASEILAAVGLSARTTHFPAQLSGGERQRVALARALVTKPRCVLADEPTGNLDRNTARQMYDLIQNVNRETGVAFVIVTHDTELASRAHRTLAMLDGVLGSL